MELAGNTRISGIPACSCLAGRQAAGRLRSPDAPTFQSESRLSQRRTSGLGRRRIKLVIFDLDGTLIDAYDAIVESFNYTMRKIGIRQRSYQTIKRAVGWGDRGLLCPFVPEDKLGMALKIYQTHHKNSLSKYTRFLPGAKEVLRYLKNRGYQLAVASNRPKDFTQIVIRKLKLKHFFDYVLCGNELKRAKPHPDILLKIIRKLAIKKKEALYVGDMTIDVNTGKNAGIRTIAVTTGSSSRRELAKLKPFILLKNVSGLVKMLS